MGKTVALKRFITPPTKHEELARLRKLQEKYIKSLDSDELKALEEHLLGPYQSAGGIGGAGLTDYGSKELAERLDAIIAGAPRMRDPMTVFRGSSRGRMIPDNEYPLTTTIDPGHAETYAEGWSGDRGLVNEIQVPERSPALALPDEDLYHELTGELTPFGDELEVLLPKSDLELLRKYETEGWDPGPGADAVEFEKVLYNPPYRAEGGLV